MIDDNKPTVISLSTGLSNKQIDLKICKILKKLRPSEQTGHLISITNEGTDAEKINNKS